MLPIFNALAPLVLLSIVGVILKLKVANNSWVDILNGVALYAFFPALILRGISQINLQNGNDFKFILINLCLLIAIIAALFGGAKAFGLSKKLVNTYTTAVFFANIGYLGFPIITSLYKGSEAIVSIHIAIYTFLLFSIVLSILEYSKDGALDRKLFLNILKNPLILATLISLILVILNIKLPFVVNKAINLLANGATPTVLIALGIFLATKLPKISYIHLGILTALKLIVMPLIFLFVYQYYNSFEFKISVLEAAMPVAITPFVLANIYNLDKNLIAGAIVVSSILSLITLPLFILGV